jgi:hypothetical protein
VKYILREMMRRVLGRGGKVVFVVAIVLSSWYWLC